ncbi:hypothetical protein Glove_155g146 [Diversispora epigaea]|uniref:Uncharacterized protein n=1 Tax=Diversispora epigaea TaxID=1348612 RepID=A0A397J1C2_9GLOM|nr:hypothetical protein Glove_155g146 [Diversispora epigaea]
MFTSYKCSYCNIRYFSNRNSYSQHVNRCINLYDVSTEESNTEVSEVTDMLLDNDDFNRIEERQSVQEIENLSSGSEITDLFEYDDYDTDASVSLEVISNIPERFEEILSESSQNEDSDVENLQNEDSNIERLQNEDLDVRSESSRNEDSDVEEFPNESYADLITLIENEQSYGEQYTGNWLLNKEKKKKEKENRGVTHNLLHWWKKVKESILLVAYILSIILYSDATTTDTLDVKQLLGYLPILSAKDEREKKSSEFKKLVRETFHNSIKFLLNPLFINDDDGDGIELKIDNEIFWFFLRVSTIICDWPEACTFSLTYKSTNSNYPCHFCLVSKENLNNTRLRDNQMVLRNKENMLQYYNNGTTEKASLELVFNYFWNILNINVYIATVPDRMHHLDLGLYYYQIEFTKKLLFEAKGRSLVELQSIALLIADNYRNIMKVMVFVVDDLLNKDLSEEAIEKWANLFIKLFAINGYTTETYKALHKTYVKIPYRLSNKKDVEEQMMKTINININYHVKL